jgi:hypothetical protein
VKYVGICLDCSKNAAVSVEGWCLKCLKRRLNHKFGYVPRGYTGTARPPEKRQSTNDDPSPWQENAIRAMEDA